MSDRDRCELRGPIRTADIHRTWSHRKCGPVESDACQLTESGDQSIFEFRPDGAISRHWHRNPDGSKITETHEYDPAGRLVSVQFESSSGPAHLRLYEYDSLGRLTRHFSRDPQGNEHTLDSYSYDAQGRKSKAHAAPQLRNYGYGIEGSASFYSAANAAMIITNYNAADRPTEILFQDASGALLSRVELHHDESGHLTEEIQTSVLSAYSSSFQEGLSAEQIGLIQSVLAGPLARQLHRYDSQGNRIETLRSLFGSLGNERINMEYNLYGDLVAQTSEEESHQYGFDDQGQLAEGPIHRNRSETRVRYNYDSHSNWTNKITEVRHADNADFSETAAERRSLIYYDPI